MDVHTAQLTLYAVASAGAAVWLAGLWFLLRFRRERGGSEPERFDRDEPASENLILGTAEVEGQPADLAARAAALLARGQVAPWGPFRILERTEARVQFEGGGPVQASNRAASAGGLRRGLLRFVPAGPGRTCVAYAVELSSGRLLPWLGVLFQVLGAISLVTGFVLLQTYVVPHADPAVRVQALQMLQVVHFLWPPFLFVFLYRFRRRVVQKAMAIFVHNLPYLADD